MSEPSASLPEGTVVAPGFCPRCQQKIVRSLHLKASDPWRSAVIIINILMFQVASADETLWKRCEDIQGLGAILNSEIGCLGCRYPRGITAAIALVRVDDGHTAARVSQGKATDPRFNFKSLARR